MNASLMQNAYALHQAGRLAEAARIYDDVLGRELTHKDALYRLGLIHFQRRDFTSALAVFDRLIASHPNVADGYAARGAALSNLGRHTEALAAYDKAVALNPNQTTAWDHRGNALLEIGRAGDALQSYDRSIALKPDNAPAWRHRSIALLRLERPSEALASLNRAIALVPSDITALEQRGNLLMGFHRHAEAVADYDRVLANGRESADLFYNRANAHSILKNYDAAIRDSTRVLALEPDYPYARGVLVHSKLQCCDWGGLDVETAKISTALADGKPVISPFNLKALSNSPAEHLTCAQAWVDRECPPSAPLWRSEHRRHDRIRLAYVSADLNNTAVATLMTGVFEKHDRDRFETIAVSFGPNTVTPMRTRLEAAFESFLDLRDKSDGEIAALLRSMEVDIAVDLMGFTGACRPRIFAARSSAIQVNYLGFPGTMGAPYIDYILADRIVIPEDHKTYYAENIAYLPNTYLPSDAKRPIAAQTMTRAEAGLPEKGFVFCSFNNSYKLSSAMFDIWMRLLANVPGSVLWLPQTHPLAMTNLRREAQSRNISPARIIFAPPIGPADEHLARLRLADIFLDTLPFNAHTTASDALWAGLPLLTCAGGSFAGRVAASLLTAIGLPELITHSLEQYEALALRLAREPGTLTGLRERLARNRDASPLFDTARFARNLESAFSIMWQRAQRGEPPVTFSVDGTP